MSIFEEFEVYATITGFNHFPNAKRLLEGDKIMLCREPDNAYDEFAISVYSDFGKIGYIANSERTVRKGTLSAKRLAELIDDTAVATVTEGGYYEAICKVADVYDLDEMILKACGLYNETNYAEAMPLFLKICERHNSVMLMQYTADCLIKQDKYAESLEFAMRAVELEENNKSSLMMYATVLQKLGRYDEAIEHYTKILELEDNKIVRCALDECRKLNKNEK